MRGYGHDAASILCASDELKRPCYEVGSPVFCVSAISKSQFDFVGMTSQKQDFCNLGAYTRVAK